MLILPNKYICTKFRLWHWAKFKGVLECEVRWKVGPSTGLFVLFVCLFVFFFGFVFCFFVFVFVCFVFVSFFVLFCFVCLFVCFVLFCFFFCSLFCFVLFFSMGMSGVKRWKGGLKKCFFFFFFFFFFAEVGSKLWASILYWLYRSMV